MTKKEKLEDIRLKISLSGISLLFFTCSLILANNNELIIVHPLLSIIGIFFSSVFFCLFLFAYKKEEKRKIKGDPIYSKIRKDIDIRINDLKDDNSLTDNEKQKVKLELVKLSVYIGDLYLNSLK